MRARPTPEAPARVVLLTDFGTADGYAAAVAAVVVAAAPGVLIDQATHAIPPGDILAGALALSRYAGLYPAGTVHLAVVDPGVGSARRALVATIDGRHYVAPDNGLLTFVLRGATSARLVAMSPTTHDDAAPTFHGRDIFAPVAARLARGEPVDALGSVVHDPVLLRLPEPARSSGVIRGEVLHVDRFGSLISNIPAVWLRDVRNADGGLVAVEGLTVGPIRRTYADVSSGQPLALIGSLELLEVAVRDGHAADRFGIGRGASVTVTSSDPP